MQLYHITDKYIDYLRTFDSTVPYNKQETRPYVGVVIKIDDLEYYAPLSSPKPKHLKMKNSKDFYKIQNGKLGAINFNNMIPVPNTELIQINILKESDPKYRRLLQKQYYEIQHNASNISNYAFRLRTMLLKDENQLNNNDIKVKSRCCNLKKLEMAYANYKN